MTNSRSVQLPAGANLEEMKKNPELFMDLRKPYGVICGATMAPARFEQDGKYFNVQGRLVENPKF